MRITYATRRALPDRLSRGIARMAQIATSDTLRGGARALAIVNRLERMGSPNTWEYHDVITTCYHSSTGRVPDSVRAVECPECGCAHLGVDAALACCAESDDWSDDESSDESDE
jgi:hypothetical protein